MGESVEMEEYANEPFGCKIINFQNGTEEAKYILNGLATEPDGPTFIKDPNIKGNTKTNEIITISSRDSKMKEMYNLID